MIRRDDHGVTLGSVIPYDSSNKSKILPTL